MISNQVLQNTLEGLKEIPEQNFVYSTQKAKCLQVLLQIFPLQHRMYRLS